MAKEDNEFFDDEEFGEFKARLESIKFTNNFRMLLDMLKDPLVRKGMLKQERTRKALKHLRKQIGAYLRNHPA